MNIRFEMQPDERDNIITKTEAFIDYILHEFRSMDPEEREIQILSDLSCAEHIIAAEINRRCDIGRVI